MNFVEPVRDRRKLTQIKNLLRGEQRYRDLTTIYSRNQYRVARVRSIEIADR